MFKVYNKLIQFLVTTKDNGLTISCSLDTPFDVAGGDSEPISFEISLGHRTSDRNFLHY